MVANEDMKGPIDALITIMEAGFESVRAEIETLCYVKNSNMTKHGTQSLKQSITFTQDEVDSLKEKAETNMKIMKGGLEELNKKIVALEDQLNAAIDEN